MAKIDKRIDDYIDKAQEFAVPVLIHLRNLVHKACPDVTETMKWSFPHFEYKGNILCSMASFKVHCSFGFWKGTLMSDKDKLFAREAEGGMGHLGKITSLKDLPSDKKLIAYIKEAMVLCGNDIKPIKAKVTPLKEIEVPEFFIKELKRDKKALKTFESFSNSNKKEYVVWVTEAKTESTRQNRMQTAIDWMAEGKIRNWKYLKK